MCAPIFLKNCLFSSTHTLHYSISFIVAAPSQSIQIVFLPEINWKQHKHTLPHYLLRDVIRLEIRDLWCVTIAHLRFLSGSITIFMVEIANNRVLRWQTANDSGENNHQIEYYRSNFPISIH